MDSPTDPHTLAMIFYIWLAVITLGFPAGLSFIYHLHYDEVCKGREINFLLMDTHTLEIIGYASLLALALVFPAAVLLLVYKMEKDWRRFTRPWRNPKKK